MDFKALASRLGFEDDEFMELVTLFVDTSLADIKKIEEAIRGNSSADVAAAAHSLKGAAANLGFDAIAELSMYIELEAKAGALEGFESRVLDLKEQILSLKGGGA